MLKGRKAPSTDAHSAVRRRTIGAKIIQWRREAGLTQADLAERFGFSSSQFISNWERGVATPPVAYIAQFPDVFGVSKASVARTYDEYLEGVSRMFKTEFRAILRAQGN